MSFSSMILLCREKLNTKCTSSSSCAQQVSTNAHSPLWKEYSESRVITTTATALTTKLWHALWLQVDTRGESREASEAEKYAGTTFYKVIVNLRTAAIVPPLKYESSRNANSHCHGSRKNTVGCEVIAYLSRKTRVVTYVYTARTVVTASKTLSLKG